MIEDVGLFEIGLKQSFPYEIRTQVFKIKVEDIDKIKATWRLRRNMDAR